MRREKAERFVTVCYFHFLEEKTNSGQTARSERKIS
jgi:hypothetical protein